MGRDHQRQGHGGGDRGSRPLGRHGQSSDRGRPSDRDHNRYTRDSRGRDKPGGRRADDDRGNRSISPSHARALPPPPSRGSSGPRVAVGGNSIMQDSARLLREKALAAQAGLPKDDPEDGEVPQGDTEVTGKPRHAPIVWSKAGPGKVTTPATTPPGPARLPGSGGVGKPPLHSYRSPLQKGSGAPASPAVASPLAPGRWGGASGGLTGLMSEVEQIKHSEKLMGYDPDAPVPLKSSPSVSSDDEGIAKEMSMKIAKAANSKRDRIEGSSQEEEEAQQAPAPRKKASRWMDMDNEEVEQPRQQQATPEDEVAAMEELNKKELEEVENDDASSEDSDIGQPDDTPIRRAPDMLQECRSVFTYERIRKISEGTYGVVYKARNLKTEELVALKRVKMVAHAYKEGFPRTAIREMNILIQFHHPNIVNVSEVVIGRKSDEIYMVMEYMEHDLKNMMDNSMKQPFSVSETKQLMLQLLAGVSYLHENWILHRDLKTSNILYSNKGQLKVCDFGLARQFAKDPNDSSDYQAPKYTFNVVTLWYRAPELLFGDEIYSTPVDVWSCGCIMAEFLTKKPLFDGQGELDQLSKMFATLGAPTEAIWPRLKDLPTAKKLNLSKSNKYNNLRTKFPKAAFGGGPCLSDAGFDLLNRMLTYDPEKRITCKEAMDHEWFRESPLPKDPAFMPTFPTVDDAAEKARKSASAHAIAAAMNRVGSGGSLGALK